MKFALRRTSFPAWLVLICGVLGIVPRAAAVWIELHDANGWLTDNVKNDTAQRLKELAAKNDKVFDVAFDPAGDWVVLFGASGWWAGNTDLAAVKKIVELGKAPHHLKCLAFTPQGGWVLLYDQNSYAADGIGPELRKTLDDLAAKDGTLKWIAFTPQGGWCVLHDKNGYITRRIPDDCHKAIADRVAGDSELTTITFPPAGGWIFFCDKNDFRASGLPDDALQKLQEVQKTSDPHFITFAPPAVQFDPKATYRLVSKPARQIHATLTQDLAIPGGRVDEWVVFAPFVPDISGQRSMKTVLGSPAEIVHEDSPLHRQVWLTRITDHRKLVHLSMTIDGTLLTRQLRIVPPGQKLPQVQDLTPEQVQHFTRPCFSLDFNDKAFREWMNKDGLNRAAEESALAYGHRVFTFLKRHYTYEYPTKNHRASEACVAQKTDCEGMSSMFAAIMRAHGIPARLRAGRWAISQKPGNTVGDFGFWHVKADFFVNGVGWVPVDGASALGDADGENRCFGNDPGDFITFTNDGDLLVDTLVFGKKNIAVLQGFSYWWRGDADGKNTRDDSMWTVEEPKAPEPR